MGKITRSTHNDRILFEGRFENFKGALEQAVSDRVALNGVNLRNLDLSNTNLDDAVMPYADFTGSNLSGANISESYLKNANFTGAALYNTCLCDSNLTTANFHSASFGATDIHGCIITGAQFSTLSCFSLEFSNVRNMGGCVFINPDGRICTMSKPPIVVRGLGRDPLIIMDEAAKSGYNIIDHKRLQPLKDKLADIRTRINAHKSIAA